MGFFSSVETQPNYWYYNREAAQQEESEAFYGQVEAYTTYTNQLWEQWSNYASMAAKYLETLGTSVDSKYNLMKSDLEKDYSDRKDDINKRFDDIKKTKYRDLARRGLATTTRGQFDRAYTEQEEEFQSDLEENRTRALQSLEAQRAEWEEQLAAREFEVGSQLEGMKPLMMNPGPMMRLEYQRRMREIGEAGAQQDLVTGESPGFGSTLLQLGGAAAGAAFGGPSGMMLGSSIGQAAGGGLEAAFGESNYYRNQGMNQMLQGGMSAMMTGFSPYADWSFDPGQQYGQDPFGSGNWLNYGDYQTQASNFGAFQNFFGRYGQ